MLSMFTKRKPTVAAAAVALAGLGLPGLTQEAQAGPRHDGVTIAVGSHHGVKHTPINVGGKFEGRGKGRVEAGNHNHARGGVTVLAYRGGERYHSGDRGRYDRGDRYERRRGHRGHQGHQSHQGHGPHCTSGYYRKVWVDPIYRTVYPRCGRPYRVIVRAGYYKTVWVPGKCGSGCGYGH